MNESEAAKAEEKRNGVELIQTDFGQSGTSVLGDKVDLKENESVCVCVCVYVYVLVRKDHQ